MASRLKRITNKVFGSTASTTGSADTGAEIGQFGSAKAGTYNATADVETIQALPAYEQGWIGAVIPDQQYPTLPEMTGVNKVLSYQTGYLFQEGIPEWDAGTTYYKNSIVKYAEVITTQTTTASIGASTGITSASVNKDTFITQITVDGSYTFTYNGTSWLFNEIMSDLSLYGITFEGTASANDTITVTLTTTQTSQRASAYISLTNDNINHNPLTDADNWSVWEIGDYANKSLTNLSTAGKALLNSYGVAPSCVKHKDIQKGDTGFKLTWTDPDDTVTANGSKLVEWDKTVIVRKLGSYPTTIYDGDTVVTTTTRNMYSTDAYIDEVDNTLDYKYRAFPTSKTGIYSTSDNNKFGQWIYSFTRIMNETVPAEKIVYRGTNEHYANAYTNYSNNNKVELGDWENAPFLLKDRLAPCAVSFAGELKYFLDVNDYTKKEDGTSSDNTNTASELNFFMRIKLLYRRKRKNADGNTEVDISNEKVNDEYKPYGGFVKTDGTLREYIYLPIYRGSLINSKVRSISGQTPMSGQTAPNERTYCKNNGSGHDMITRADRELIEDIYMLMFKNMDSQTALGAGKSNGGSDVGACLKSGTMDKKGLFHGSTSTAEGIKFLGMENRYASQWERILGEVLVNGVRKVKLCQGTSDGSTVDDFNFTGDGYITLSELPTISGSSGGYISKEQTVDDIGTFPVVVSGSSSTNECDGMWFNNSGTMVALGGGASHLGSLCGFFCSDLNSTASDEHWAIGSSVSYKPL